MVNKQVIIIIFFLSICGTAFFHYQYAKELL